MKPEQVLTREAAMVALLTLWSIFIGAGCSSVVTAPALATATPPSAAATATAIPRGAEAPTPGPGRVSNAGPESAIQERSKKIAFGPGEQRWFALPIDETTGKAVVDLRILGMDPGAIDKLVDAGVLDGKVYSPDEFNELAEWRLQRATQPMPKGRLTKMPDSAGARLHWDGGNRNFVNQPSLFPNLPKGAWILSVTYIGPQSLDTLFSVK